jgi:hypothetical protein
MSNASLHQPDDPEVVDDTPIVRALSLLRWEIPGDVDESVLSAAGAALDDARVTSTRHPRWWRRSWPRAVAAGLLLAGAVAALVVLTAGPSFTLADVVKAAGGQKWVHIKYDSGMEEWHSLADGSTFGRIGTHIAWRYDASGRMHSYWEKTKVIYDTALPAGFIGPEKERLGKDAWARLVAPLERKAGEKPAEVERHDDRLPDQGKTVRFDVFDVDYLGKRSLIRQLWADPKTRLPVRVRVRQPGARGDYGQPKEDQETKWIVGEFSFPETGPASLADLGVPKGTPVVGPDAVGGDYQDVFKKIRAAAQRFPKTYRAVYRRAGKEVGGIGPYVMWRDGERMRCEVYFDTQSGKRAMPIPSTEEQLLKWAAGQKTVDAELYDGKVTFRRVDPGGKQEPFAHVINNSPYGASLASLYRFPHEYQWMNAYNFNVRRLRPGEEKDAPRGCMGFRLEGAGRRDFWVDPSHDFLLVRDVWFVKDEKGEWRRDTAKVLGDLARLPGGQWYGRSFIEQEFLPPPHDKDGPVLRGYRIDVTPMKSDELPKDLFDGPELIKGLKVVTN